MRKIAYIFILLFCFGFKLFSAKTEHVFLLKQLLDLCKYESTSKEKSPISIINTKDYLSSKKIRQIRQKGLASVCYLFTYKSPLLVDLSSKKLIPSAQTFYILRLFFGNEKRGPPSVLVS